MSSQYGDHFCKIFSKDNFELQIYALDNILLQGCAVTLTFNAGTQILCATSRLNMVVISVKQIRNATSNNEVMGRKQTGGTRMGRTRIWTDGRTRRRLYPPQNYFGEHKKMVGDQWNKRSKLQQEGPKGPGSLT